MKMEMVMESNKIFMPDYQGFGMDPFSDRIWIGGCACARDHEDLKGKGITAVINLTPDDFGTADAGIPTFQIPVDDAEEIRDHNIKLFIDKMDELWAAGDTIYIHCHAGISRTSSFLIAWLMHTRGCNKYSNLRAEWSVAEDSVMLARPIIMPHYKLKGSILRYFESVE